MRRRPADLEPELEAFLKPCRIKRGVPPEIRERALANARAIVAAGGVISPAPPQVQRWASLPISPGRPRRRVWIALAASVAVAGAAVGAVAALRMRTNDPLPDPQPGVLVIPAAKPPQAVQEPDVPVTERTRAARPSRATRAVADPLALEIELLQRAHEAYRRGDVTASLKLATEHARRFPNGRLAEEREALRVRSLAATGRGTDARRAVADFARRFPHSVLLPSLQQTSVMAE